MTNPSAGVSNTEDRWLELIAVMRGDLETLSERFRADLSALWPYSEGVVPMAVVARDAHASFEHLLLTLAGEEGDESIAEVVGRDRARRRVPLDALIAAVRLDFAVVWSHLKHVAGDGDLEVLVAHVDRIWKAVEEYSTRIQFSYLAEQALIAREVEAERHALVRALLRGPVSEALVGRVAVALKMPADGNVAVLGVREQQRPGLWRAYQKAVAAGRECHWHEEDGGSLLLVAWHSEDESLLPMLAEGADAAVGPLAHGLADVPRVARLVDLMSRVLETGPPGLLTVREALPAMVAGELTQLWEVLEDVVLGGLGAVTRPTADRLLETLQAHAATGSVQECARLLFCHRNTVQNRLRQWRDLTGFDPMVPEQMFLLVLAVHARQAHARRRTDAVGHDA